MADRDDRGADLPQRDAGRRRLSEVARTARSFALGRVAGSADAAVRLPEVIALPVEKPRSEV